MQIKGALIGAGVTVLVIAGGITATAIANANSDGGDQPVTEPTATTSQPPVVPPNPTPSPTAISTPEPAVSEAAPAPVQPAEPVQPGARGPGLAGRADR